MTDEPKTPSQKRVKIWTPEDDRRAKHCAIWLQSCSRTHQLWCDCPDWTSHIKRCGGGENTGGVAGETDPGDEKRVLVDAFGGLVPGPGAER
nr:ORF2 [Torque teno felis virus]